MADGERDVLHEIEKDARETEERMAEADLDEARESLAILEDTERFLIQEIGGGGYLTLDNTAKWADEVRETRKLIAEQKSAIGRMEAEKDGVER